MKLDEIIITEAFAETTPKASKLDKVMKYCLAHYDIDKPIVVNTNNVLVDGYVRYLALKMMGIDETNRIKMIATREVPKTTTYVYGRHPGQKSNKEFCWRIPCSGRWKDFASRLEVGDLIQCRTKFGIKPVIITKIVTTDVKPMDLEGLTIQKVARRVKGNSSDLISDMENLCVRC